MDFPLKKKIVNVKLKPIRILWKGLMALTAKLIASSKLGIEKSHHEIPSHDCNHLNMIYSKKLVKIPPKKILHRMYKRKKKRPYFIVGG